MGEDVVMTIYCRTRAAPTNHWWERDYQDSELYNLVRSIVERDHQVEVKVKVDGVKQWTPLLEAYPGLADEGEVLCAKCRRFYVSDDCEMEVIEQRWGTVKRVLCPEGHIAKSAEHFSATVASWLRRQHKRSLTDLARGKEERDRGPFPMGH
jgi:hypothetical protein